MTSIRGLKELNRKFSKLMAVATTEQLETALVSGALLIANKAKENAHVLTGTMRRSIHIGDNTGKTHDFQSKSEDSGKYSDIGKISAGRNNAKVKIGSNLRYAAVEEFRGGNHAYLRPAADTEAQAARVEVAEALEILVMRAAS